MNNDILINNLLRVNEYICSQGVLWNQGQGGNVSVKTSDSALYIKPSGFRLDDLNDISDFIKVDFHMLNESLTKIIAANKNETYSEMNYSQALELSKLDSSSPLRPSMELGFHSVIPSKYVLHFHSLLCMLLLEKPCSELLLKLKTNYPISDLDYFTPGFFLTKKLMNQNFTKKIYLLKNHGVIFHFDDPNEFEMFKSFHLDLLIGLNTVFKLDCLKIVEDTLNSRSISCDFKYFFPDIAIMEDKIKKNLVKEKNNTYFIRQEESVSVNILENWQAICIIQKIFPGCETLPTVEVNKLVNLPSEIARIKQMEKT